MKLLFCKHVVLVFLLPLVAFGGSPQKEYPVSVKAERGIQTIREAASGEGLVERESSSIAIGLRNTMQEIAYTTPGRETGYVYIPSSVLADKDRLVPMVLMLCCTGGDPRTDARLCGWIDKALKENIIVMAPDYDNYATYSQTDRIISAVRYIMDIYPVDRRRVYSTGFSNGGATSVALCSKYPTVFAAISAYGWMVDMRGQDAAYDMPFQVIQGTREYTYATDSGAMAIMVDEQEAIRSLLLYNEMIGEGLRTDYDATPYWGYAPAATHANTPDGRKWTFYDYYKKGFAAPFAQFVLIDGATHRQNAHEAEATWEFFKKFSRGTDGRTVEEYAQ